jgi:hypothetical protein
MLEGVLIDEAIAVLVQLARECRRAPRARAIDEPLGALAGKAIDPCAQGGRRKLERVGDGLQALPFDDLAHGLGTAEDTCLSGLCQERISGGQGVIGKEQFEGPHASGLQNKLLQK